MKTLQILKMSTLTELPQVRFDGVRVIDMVYPYHEDKLTVKYILTFQVIKTLYSKGLEWQNKYTIKPIEHKYALQTLVQLRMAQNEGKLIKIKL